MPPLHRLPLLAILLSHELHPQQPPRHDQISMRNAPVTQEREPAVTRAVQEPAYEPERTLDLGPLRGPLGGRADLLYGGVEHLLARTLEVGLGDGIENRQLAREEERRDGGHDVRAERVLERSLYRFISLRVSARRIGDKDARERRESPWA